MEFRANQIITSSFAVLISHYALCSVQVYVSVSPAVVQLLLVS